MSAIPICAASSAISARAERDALLREPGGGWTAADVPLLDEAAELLGEDDRTVRERAKKERRKRIAYARGVLDLAYGSRSVDLNPEEEAEILSAYDILDAERLADRYEEDDDRTAVERAAADRTWAFGHIVVDEAQELSPMAWRMLMRRCPSKSMTIVGDMAQASELGGGSSWQQVLGPNLGDRYRMERLTINYRTPAEIAEVAADVLDVLARLVPRDDGYAHLEGNSDSHVKSIMVGCSQLLGVAGGAPVLGRWQRIFFCEFDGPRQRQLLVLRI